MLTVNAFTTVVESALEGKPTSPTRLEPVWTALADALGADVSTVYASYITRGSANFKNRFGQAGFERATSLGVGLLDDERYVPGAVEYVQARMAAGDFVGPVAVAAPGSDGFWSVRAVVSPEGSEIDMDRLPVHEQAEQTSVAGSIAEGRRGEPWTDEEIDVAVDTYFEMLDHQQRNETFVKIDYRRRCEKHLASRSAKSIEYKWCNISAILEERGEEWLRGYKPLGNYQDALVRIVELKLI